MEVKWFSQDIKHGRRVSKDGIEEVWIIGYPAKPKVPDLPRCLISLSDGMVIECANPLALADLLNEGSYVPIEIARRPK